MKSFVIYGSHKKLTNSHKLITGPRQPKYFARVKVVTGDCLAAFKKVKLLPGEMLLNTMDVEGPMPPHPLRKSKQPDKTPDNNPA